MKRLGPMMLLLLVLCACGRREDVTGGDDSDRAREMERFIEAIKLVQDRYVDVDRVQLHQIISNSIKGAVAAIDPHARIYFTGMPDEVSVPDDVSLIEWSGPDGDGIMSIRIFAFTPLMKRQLKRLEPELRALRPAGILLDGRGAYGEDYEAAAAVAEWFLPRDARIGSLVENQGRREDELISRRTPFWSTNALVVLTDEALRGPGELLAAALRANERGVLVGRPTRGVAVIQTPMKLTDEWTVMLSTGEAREPGGRGITGNPIQPDIAAMPTPGNTENVDWVYLRGLSVLREQVTF